MKCVYLVYVDNKYKPEIEYNDCVVGSEKEAKEMCEKLNKSKRVEKHDIEFRYEKLQFVGE